MTTQKVLEEAKKYCDNNHIYIINNKRDKRIFLIQMEKVLSVKDKITQNIIDISKGKTDRIMQFSKIYTFSYLKILHEFESKDLFEPLH